MVLGGLHLEVQRRGDVLRRLALGDELQHLPIARGQRIVVDVLSRQVCLHDDAGDAGAEIHAAGEHLAERVEELGRRLRLDDEAADAGAQRRHDVVLLTVDREEHDRGAASLRDDRARRVHAVQERHRHVHDDDVGVMFLCEAHGLPTVRRFGDDLEAGAIEQRAEPFTNDVVIVNEQNTCAHCHPPGESPRPNRCRTCRRANGQLGAEGKHAVVDAAQPEAGSEPAGRLESNAVVADPADERAVALLELHGQMRRARVAPDVRDGFLCEAVHRGLDRRRQRPVHACREGDGDAAAHADTVEQRAHRGDKPEIVEHAGAKLVREPTQPLLDIIEMLLHRVEICAYRRGAPSPAAASAVCAAVRS